jgi:predicted dehydrogenase
VEDGHDRRPGAALVCTPPSAHAGPARAALQRGIRCFVEKPVAHSAAAAASLKALRGAPLVVGYQLRRHAAVKELKRRVESGALGRLLYVRAQVGQYLPDWRPWQDYRRSYTARKALGGGILLDASHEIDLARHLAGEPVSVYCSARKLSSLDVDVEDTAELTLSFASGAMGSVHLDMIRRAYDRSCQLSFEDGVLEWRYQDSLLREYSAKKRRWTERRLGEDGNEQYLEELAMFLRREPRLDGLATVQDGIRALRVVEAAKRSARSGRREAVR